MRKVNVIIPVYNGERFIKEAVDSVLSQTFEDFEMIVVDDGSTDQTKEIINEVYKNIIYKYQLNAGPSAARNMGIASGSSEYVAFLDHDDRWYPEKLAKQVAILDNDSTVGLVCGEVNNINEDGNLIKKKTWAERRRIKSDLLGNVQSLLRRKFPVAVPSTMLVRRHLLEKVGRFDDKIPFGGYGELEFCAKIADYSKIYFMIQPLVEYRIRHGQITSEKESELYANYVLVLDKLWQRWRDEPEKRALLLKLYARYWFKRGRERLKESDFDSAARFLVGALRFRPLYIRPWLSLLRLQVKKRLSRSSD